jgi:hypothetical protein
MACVARKGEAMRRSIRAVLFMLLGALWVLPSTASAANDTGPSIFPRTVKPYGVSYGAWTERQLQWAFGSTAARDPIAHPENCSLHQQDGLFFGTNVAFGSARTVTCTIRAGTPLLFSPGGGGCDSSLGGPNTREDLLACTTDGIAGLTAFDVTIDTVEVPEIERFRFQTPVFNFRYAAGNSYGVPAGTYKALGVAYTIVIRPLPKGVHTIALHDELVSGRSADITFRLRVV